MVAAASEAKDCGLNVGCRPSAPASLTLDQSRILNRIVYVMSGIAFVTGELQGPVDCKCEILIDLNQALEVSVVIAISVPRLVTHIFDFHSFSIGKRQVFEGSFAATCQGTAHYGGKTFCGDEELRVKRRVPIGQWRGSGQQQGEFCSYVR